jgi:hypothetical protein
MKLATKCIAGFAALCLAALSLAQETGPPAELAKLDWMLGEWTGTMKWTPESGMAGEMTSSMKTDWDGQFMRTVASSDMGGLKITETSYMGWEAKSGKFVMYTFTNFAPTPRIERGTIDRDTWVFESEPWEVMGQAMKSRSTMKRKGNEMTFVLELDVNGKWVKAAEGTMKKKA